MDISSLISLINSHLGLHGIVVPGYTQNYYSDNEALGILYRTIPNILPTFLDRDKTYSNQVLSALIDKCIDDVELVDAIYGSIWKVAKSGNYRTIPYWRLAQDMNYSLSALSRKRKLMGEAFARALVRLDYHASTVKEVVVIPATSRIDELFRSFGLSLREQSVLLEFVRGTSAGRPKIIKDLAISKNTLKVHIRNINKKMKTKTLNEAVEIIRRNISGLKPNTPESLPTGGGV